MRTRPLKALFTKNNAFNRMVESGHEFRAIELEATAKMLACGTTMLGGMHYHCENSHCQHSKVIKASCKSKLCQSCGQKATERWIAIQMEVLPDCAWRHITFTMPDTFWEVFKLNRALLGKLFSIASEGLLSFALLKKLTIGIFSALHTYGRQLNFNCHIHLSVSAIGLTKDEALRPFHYPFKALKSLWRYGVTSLLRNHFNELTLPEKLGKRVSNEKEWNRVLDKEYQKTWQVNIAKTTTHKAHTANYLGRYLKKPPIAGSRLRHYAGESVTMGYHDHRSNRAKELELSQMELIVRILSHVPEKNFKMVRNYGFLSNRLRGSLLPILYEKLKQVVKEVVPPSYAAMLKSYVKVDPYECILCGGRMMFSRFESGVSLYTLVLGLRRLAKLKRVEA